VTGRRWDDLLMDDAVPETLARFGLEGRAALVTGASSGLGAAIARTLAGAGARVAVVARRLDRLEALADETGGVAVACDLLEPDEVPGLVATVAERLGGIEILVNAAGMIAEVTKAEQERFEAAMQTLTLNLITPMRLCQEVFPHMRAAGRGAIVHISSIGGHVGIPGIPQASYAASKAGLSGLTVELAVQWARHSIRVNTIAPGFFKSEITAGMWDDERQRDWLHRNQPLPLDAEPDDLTGGVLWLVSDAGRFVTGQTIAVDGGWTAR
jgi:NAD(P)-dependent dehydrogenase (short-subunit alcohol dehydrogenase family)